MSLDTQAPDISFALDIVRKAGRLARKIQVQMAMMNMTKSDLSPVTVADFAIQALVAHGLEKAFPGDLLVAEERSAELRESAQTFETVQRFLAPCLPDADGDEICRLIDLGGADGGARFWTLDPVDGTKGYLRGGQYAVALALVCEGKVQTAVLGCPNLKETCEAATCGAGALVAASRGNGTWAASYADDAEFSQIHVSDCREGASARLLRSHEAAHTNANKIDAFAREMGMEADPVLMDSQAKCAVLASGRAEVMLRLLSPSQPDYKEKIWDLAAGSLVIEEAGGRITDLHGLDLDFTQGRTLAANRGVAATNGFLHEAALEALAKVDRSDA